MRWSVQRRIHELKAPATAAHGTTFKRDMLLLSLTDGVHTGWGEASPLSSYSGVTADECDAALRPRLDLLAGADPDDPDSTLRGCAEGLIGPTRAALEVALRDLAARRAGISLLEAFGVTSARSVDIRALLSSTDLSVAQAEAEAAKRAGFRAVKAKVATGGASDHVRMQALHDALGSDIHLSADANGAWNVSQALDQLAALSETVDLIEQPVRGLAEMRELKGTSGIPLGLDEDATEIGAFDQPLAADVVCLKLQAWGGLDNLIQAAGRAREAGLLVTYGSTLDGPVGIAASLIAAQAVQPDLACGLGTLEAFEESFDALEVADGQMSSPEGPGLGTDPEGTRC